MLYRCTYHPKVETTLGCNRCERPICAACAVQTPVGARCPECAQARQLPTFDINPWFVARGTAAGIGTAVTMGLLAGTILVLGLIPQEMLLISVLVAIGGSGYVVGEAVSLATNRKRGIALQVVSSVCFLVFVTVFSFLTGGLMLSNIYAVIAVIAGLALSSGRLRRS